MIHQTVAVATLAVLVFWAATGFGALHAAWELVQRFPKAPE
jgi:hypothetical protein